jgi:hypothetical protein
VTTKWADMLKEASISCKDAVVGSIPIRSTYCLDFSKKTGTRFTTSVGVTKHNIFPKGGYSNEIQYPHENRS